MGFHFSGQKPMPIQHLSRLVMLAFGAACAVAQAAPLSVHVTDAAGKPVPDAVVSLEADGGQALPKPLRAGEISQKGLKFIPLVTVIQTGSKIYFPNNDRSEERRVGKEC